MHNNVIGIYALQSQITNTVIYIFLRSSMPANPVIRYVNGLDLSQQRTPHGRQQPFKNASIRRRRLLASINYVHNRTDSCVFVWSRRGQVWQEKGVVMRFCTYCCEYFTFCTFSCCETSQALKAIWSSSYLEI